MLRDSIFFFAIVIVLLQSFFHYGFVGKGGDHRIALLVRRIINSSL